MNAKRGQMSVFIIIAVIIVAAVIAYLIFRSRGTTEAMPAELAPVFDYYSSCIEQDVKAGASLAGSQGGYIYPETYEPGSDYAPFSSQLNFFGFSVPYWYYISGNGIAKEQVPSKSDIENQMADFVKARLEECDFEEFGKRGISVEKGEPKVTISIANEKITAQVDSNIIASKENSSARKSQYSVDVSSSFGKMYALAREFYDKEKKEEFLENYSVDVLRLYAPVDGVEISCSPKVWKYPEVMEQLKDALEANIASIKLDGDYYALNNKEDKYFVVNDKTDMPVNLMYNKAWPTKIEINGAKGNLLIAEPIGNQAGLGVLGFCYAPYHFVYDVSFPVMVQFYDVNGEIFQYPIAVIIDNNMPRQANLESVSDDTSNEPDVCGFMTQDIKVGVHDIFLRKVDANISYQCFDTVCDLGSTQNGVFEGKTPACVNGELIAEAGGYKTGKVLLSTNSESSADLILDRAYNVELDVEIDGKPIDGNAIVTFMGEDSISTMIPDNKNVTLSEGRYNVSVDIYGNSSLVIPASTQRECTDVSQGGLAGLLGGTEQQCFDVNIPETKVDYALIGGGRAEVYLLPEELETGKLKIETSSFEKPDSLEKLQNNYLLVENSGLAVGE